MTNSEKIRSMTDDELAEALCEYIDCQYCPALSPCKPNGGKGNGLKKWLKNEVENDKRKDDKNEHL